MTLPTHLATPNVPLSRAWNTWTADRYVEMNFLPLGVRVTPLVYAASLGRVSRFAPGDEVTLGTHAVDGSLVEARLDHGGTVLDWRYRKPSPFDLIGSWQTIRTGEWGLRFWVVLSLSADQGGAWHFDEEAKVASFTRGPRTVALIAKKAPLLVTGHDSIAALVEEFERKGYWHLASRSIGAPVLALRFNLDEAPELTFAAGIADRPDRAVERARALLELPAPVEQSPTADDPVAAIRDVMGWNALYDRTNHRPYITCSRNWDLNKFGGFGFWLNDTLINAFLVALFDLDQARENLSLVFAGATPEGNLPCILTGNDQWVDRTQSPIASLILWMLWLRSGERSLLRAAWPLLSRNNDWLFATRDGNRNGILEFGSSPLGMGLYRGTKLAAKDESFMDNSPIHDEARFIDETGTLDCEDVGLNCLACLDSEMLGRIADVLGLDDATRKYHERAATLRSTIASHFWDDRRNIFANRLWSGAFVRSLAPTSFYPLLCGAANDAQRDHLLAHLEDEQAFGGRFGLPSVARADPAFGDNIYWRGRIWPILNWLVWLGLHRSGEHDAAARLAEKGRALFFASFRDRRLCPENYHAVSGEGLDQPDTDPFYSWSALLPYMDLAELMDISPFDGWTLTNRAEDEGALAPVLTPSGPVAVERLNGVLTLLRHGEPFFTTDVTGRITHLVLTEEQVACALPAKLAAGARLRVRSKGTILLCRQASLTLTPQVADGWIEIILQATGEHPESFRLLLA
jgi:putative isomerase